MGATGLKGAWWTQVAAQVLTAWAFVLTVGRVREPDPLVVIFALAFYGIAVVLPMRNNTTIRDRAVSCMAAGAVMASALSLQLIGIILNLRLSAANIFTLLAMVLFTVAGSLYWLRRETD